jgi:predicted secreted hydrolase
MEDEPGIAGDRTARRLNMQILLKLLLVLAVIAIIAALIIIPARMVVDPVAEPTEASFNLTGVLGAGDNGDPDAGYARATVPRSFEFPRDHGPHLEFRNEWWYFTGNLEDADGRRFGYQWVIFRAALAPEAVVRESAWGTNQAYMAHFAVTDPDNQAFHYFERFARGAAGLAGAETGPLRVWLEDWSLEMDETSGAWRVRAAQDQVMFDLEMHALKPVVLNGEQGLSRKSAAEGNASYYYALTRLDTRGIVRIGAETHIVRGSSWLDREWSTSALADDQAGWDWFALQLEDNSELMVYQLRRIDGSIDPFSSGTLTDPAGNAITLSADEVILEVLDTWRSLRGARYPSRWRLQLPARGLALEIRPILANQELDVSIPYWEGAVDVAGTRDGHAIGGRGYVELVGY